MNNDPAPRYIALELRGDHKHPLNHTLGSLIARTVELAWAEVARRWPGRKVRLLGWENALDRSRRAAIAADDMEFFARMGPGMMAGMPPNSNLQGSLTGWAG